MSSRARLLIPVVVSLVLQLPSTLYWLAMNGPTPRELVGVILALAGPLVLLAARRFPGPVVLVVSLLGSVDFFITQGMGGPPYFALAFAVVGALVRGARAWAWLSVGTVWAASLGIGLLLGRDWSPVGVAITTFGLLLVFGAGEAMRGRREMLADYRRAVQQRRQSEAQTERVRIARELHDVLAHSLSQINVQAGVGLHLMERQPEKAAEALANIKETSKTALDEVRSVLGVLRSSDGSADAPLVPEPDLSRLPGLVASVTSQGIDVTLDSTVENAPQAVQLALYRIVQESLTNIVRHSRAERATVTLREADGEYLLTVDDDGAGLTQDSAGEGRGILGMRERAELLGGSLDHSASPLGGTRVSARIPLKETR